MANVNTQQNRPKKETFMQGVVTLIFSQVIIKLLGLIYTLYLTNALFPLQQLLSFFI